MYRFHLFGKISNLKFHKNLTILYIAGFILAVGTNITAYINSSFIETFVGMQFAGLFFVAANVATFFAMLFFPKVIKSLSNFVSTQLMILLSVVSLIALIINPNPWWILLFFIAMWVGTNLLWINMDIFVESFTENMNTGKTRAIFFTFMNFGWILAPILSTRLVVDENYYNYVYLVSAFVLLIFYFLIILFKARVNKVLIFNKLNITQTIVHFWKDLNLRGIYVVSCFLNIFFGLVVVYLPFYLNTHIGFSWSILGTMFAIMLIPFVLFEIPAGIIADKYIGEKEMMFTGLGILTVSLVLFAITKSTNPVIWGAILFFSRVGAALIEAMRESRFFKIVDAEDVSHINFLRTSYPLGYLISSGIGVLILSFYSIPQLFLFLAGLFLFSFYFVYIIKDSK